MISTIALVIGGVIAALLIVIATRPSQFHVHRRTRIDAPPARVFTLINGFREWRRWSPWEGLDPDLQRSYSGAGEGKGAVYEWKGNKKVGRGRMEIIQVVPEASVAIKLDFFEPWEAHNTAEFTLSDGGSHTDVVWAMYGPANFMSKAMSLVMPMDKLVGKDFEKGLANLKREAETPSGA
jgi:uncharacterized protein YndB with AHSA1/START domain